MTTTPTTTSVRTLDVELLALDLNTCTRCTGTLDNIEQAIEAIRAVLDATGTDVQVRRILITSEEEARRHRFVSSPTIRISGRDVALETRESRCDACTDLCGCDEGTDCRVWLYRGQEHTEAPVGLIVEALLREVYRDAAAPVGAPPPAYEGVPENLKRFFAGRTEGAATSASSCCGPEEQASCCEPSEKEACCGEDGDACGCQ